MNIFCRRFLINKTIGLIKIPKKTLILGIETSCDDTGCAILNFDGDVLGEELVSQHLVHLNNGGIIPPIAQSLHRNSIENVVQMTVKKAGVAFEDLNAIATTVEPGLPLSLIIGMKYGKHLCRTYKKPFIPVHHMKAHALTARMFDKTIKFPFLVLLVSGGHCLLALANNAVDFLLLGQTFDNSPGEVLDKMARRLKLKNIPKYSKLSGGQAIELAALESENISNFKFDVPLSKYKDCNFSLAGLNNQINRHIIREEKKHNIPPDGIIPNVNDFCASVLLVLTRHLCHRIQRAIEFIELKKLIPNDQKVMVVSGGVACNNLIASGVNIVCNELGYKLVRPPHKLCTDNGVMIAWNGVELWKAGKNIYEDFEHIDIKKSSLIGPSLSEEITKENISCNWVKLTNLVNDFKNLKINSCKI